MVNENLLKSKIVLFGDTLSDLADYIGITRQTLTMKISGVTSFTQPEIKRIIMKYDLTPEETETIFFR